MRATARNVADSTGARVAAASYWNLASDQLSPFQDSEVDAIPGHACGFETAIMMVLRTELVEEEAMFSTSAGDGRSEYFKKRLQWRESKVQLPQQAGVVKEHACAGDPTKGTREYGEKVLRLIEERLGDVLQEFATGEPFTGRFAFQHQSVKAKSAEERIS